MKRIIAVFILSILSSIGCLHKKADIQPVISNVERVAKNEAINVLDQAFFPSKYIVPMDITGLTKKEIVELMEETNANVKLSAMNYPAGGINTATHLSYNADMTAGVSTKVTWDMVLEAMMLSRGITLIELDYINGGTEVIQTALNARCTASSVITDEAVVVGDGGARGVKETNVKIDSSDNVTGATSYATAKVSGEAGRSGEYEGNSTDTFITGNEGAANISADLWFKYSSVEPTNDGIMLYGAPSSNVSQRSWGYLDGITLQNDAGTIKIVDTAITPGAYTNVDITVDQQGRITVIANGTGGGGTAPTEQVGDPAYSDMSTGDWIVATGTGDLFYKSATGMYTFDGVYDIDPTAPTMLSATIPTDGLTVSVLFSEALDVGVGGNAGWTLNTPTNAMTYSSGDTTDTFIYTLASTITDTDDPTITYVQPGDGLEDAAGDDLLSLTAQAVINNSTEGTAVTCAACGTCPGCALADVLCEDWNTDNSCVWVEYQDELPDDIDEAATHSGTFACTDKGTNTLELIMNDDGSTLTSSYYGANKDVTYIQFYLNIVAEELENTNEETIMLMSQNDIASASAGGIIMVDDFGDAKLKYRYRSGDAWVYASTSVALALNTWHRIQIYHKYTDGASLDGEVGFWVDGGELLNATGVDVDRTYDYLLFGTAEGDGVLDSYTIQVDNIEVDDDTMPSACPE